MRVGTVTVVGRRPRTAALVGLAVAIALAALLVATSSIGRATSGVSPYVVPAVVDSNPAPDVVETTLVSKESTVDIGNGVSARAQTFNGSIPGPTFRLKVGDTVIVHYRNELAHPSAIHWHGIELSNAMDGTPFTQNQVATNKEFLYKFTVSRPGIYWYHPHHHASTNQVFKGLYGMIVVEDPNEVALRAAGTLPSATQTRPLVLSDTTVCKAPGSNDSETYPSTLPHVSGGPLPVQLAPTPLRLCETAAIDEDGNPRGAFAAGDIPNNQTLATNGRTNEGQTVLTNGMNVGGRGGDPGAPGALAPGAQTLDVQAGQGLRLQLLNAATTRYLRLRLTTSSGALVDLVRVGGEAGLIDNAVVEGGVIPPIGPGGFDTDYGAGEILLPPGARADVVAAIPATATGVLTLWTEDFRRTGAGFSNIPTVPVMHLNVSGTASMPYAIAAGTPLRAATGDPVATLPAASGTLLDPGSFAPPKLGIPNQEVRLTQNGTTSLGINGVFGTHDVAGDYTAAPHLGSTRYVKVGTTLELSVRNVTGAHHPFHLHGFSIQPISLTRPESPTAPTYTWPYKEFRDNVDVPAAYTLRFRVKIDDRALADGTTMSGALGRWVFHCHIFFHATNGMLGEIVVVPGTGGNEKPTVNADSTKVAVTEGQPATMTGTYDDPEGDPVTLSASRGTITDTGSGSWRWSRTATATDGGLVYITATDSGARKDQTAFALDVIPLPTTVPTTTTATTTTPVQPSPTITLTPVTATTDANRNRPHTVIATIAGAVPLDGRRILFSVSGAHTKRAAVATGAEGTAPYSYWSSNVGTDTIGACFDANSSGACDAGEPAATATKIWVLGLDHLKCYDVTPTRARSHAVLLSGSFDTWRSRTSARRTLCNPVSKNGGEVLNPMAHLVCYATRDNKGFRPRTMRITNQFGSRVIRVLKPQTLCLPTLERVLRSTGSTQPPAGPFPTKLVDHFRCYSVRAVPVSKRVRLRDQYGTTTSRVVALTQLCDPVGVIEGKRLNGVRRPPANLVCYAIRDSKRLRTPRVVVRNAFETTRLRAVRTRSLCLPTTKEAT